MQNWSKSLSQSSNSTHFIWWYCKKFMQKLKAEVVLKTVYLMTMQKINAKNWSESLSQHSLSDDDARNSGKSWKQISLKTEADSFHKTAFSSILMLHLWRHILSSKFWRKFNDSGRFSQRPDVIQNYSNILIYCIQLDQQLLSKPNPHRILHLFSHLNYFHSDVLSYFIIKWVGMQIFPPQTSWLISKLLKFKMKSEDRQRGQG